MNDLDRRTVTLEAGRTKMIRVNRKFLNDESAPAFLVEIPPLTPSGMWHYYEAYSVLVPMGSIVSNRGERYGTVECKSKFLAWLSTEDTVVLEVPGYQTNHEDFENPDDVSMVVNRVVNPPEEVKASA